MRDEISTDLIEEKFDDKAENNASEIDPPDYLADSVDEYQDEYWSSMDDVQRLYFAQRNNMADIEIEPDEDDDPLGDIESALQPQRNQWIGDYQKTQYIARELSRNRAIARSSSSRASFRDWRWRE